MLGGKGLCDMVDGRAKPERMKTMTASPSLLYPLFEMNHALLQPARLMATAASSFWQNAANPLRETRFAPKRGRR